MIPTVRAFAALALLAAALPAPAAAETLTCTDIQVLPTEITASGHYCLNANFTQDFASTAILIKASNVVLDCNDHVVTHTGAAAVNAVGAGNRAQITVRNCALNGFGRGISFTETAVGTSRNHRIANNDIRRAKLSGIQVAGSANVIENNRITSNLGGSAAATYGILVSSFGDRGVGNVVRNNIITNFATEVYVNVIGIYLLDVDNTVVANNTLSALFAPDNRYSRGIVGASTVTGTALVGNNVLAPTGAPPGGGGGLVYTGAEDYGLRFDAVPTAENRNVCRGNVVGHYTKNIQVESASNGCVSYQNTSF